MFSSRFFWRIYFNQLLLIFFAVTLFSLTVIQGYHEVCESLLRKEIETLAEGVSQQAATFFSESEFSEAKSNPMSQKLAALASASSSEIHLFAKTGEVLATSTNHPDQIGSPFRHSQVPEQGVRSFRTFKASGSQPAQEILQQSLWSQDEQIGFLQIIKSREKLESDFRQLSYLTWGCALILTLAAGILSYLITAKFLHATNELKQATESMIGGHLPQNIHLEMSDELGQLGESLSHLSRELGTRIQGLERQANQLRENSERLSTVLSGMVEGVIAVDSEDQILFANEAAFRMIEFDGRRVVGRPYWEVLRNTDVQLVVRDVVSGQYQLRREINFPRSQSRIAFIASRLPGEPCPGVVLVLQDVTELRRLEKIRSEFVSNAGHELKTPLAAIQACTETLSGGAIQDPAHAEHFLTQISEHAERLHKLIISLMDLAKIESEDEVFQFDVIDIGIPIQEAIDEHYSVARSKNIELTYRATIEELPVLADLDGVRTIVNNLIDNAINYTPAGGKVRVEWFQKQGKVEIRISDTGMGIERKHHERIFERFYRVDTARSREAGGTGLGLAIVKHLCQLFSGTIQVESEPNLGTTFIIQMPLHSENA